MFSQILNPPNYQPARVRKPGKFFGDRLDLRHKTKYIYKIEKWL